MYLLKRTDQGGGFVAKAGHRTSYVPCLCYAKVFKTKEEAERDRCKENEVIVEMESILNFK